MEKEKPKRKQKRPGLSFGVPGCFLLCVVVGVMIIAVLTLLGPTIGNIFVLTTDDEGQCEQTIAQMTADLEAPRLTAKDLWNGDLEPLTLDNAPQLREVAQVGRGYVLAVGETTDKRLLVMTSTGLWQQDSLDAEPVKLWDYYSVANKEAFFSDNAQWVMLTQYSQHPLLFNTQTGVSVPLKIDETDNPISFWKSFFSPDESRVVGINYGTVYVWETESGELLATYALQKTIHAIAFAPDNVRMAIAFSESIPKAGDTGTPVYETQYALHLWNSDTATLENSYELPAQVNRIAFDAPDSLVLDFENVMGARHYYHRLHLADGSIRETDTIPPIAPDLLGQYRSKLGHHYPDYRHGVRWLADGSLMTTVIPWAIYNPNSVSPVLHFSPGASNPSILRVCDPVTGKQQLAVLLPESSHPFLSLDGTRLWSIEAKNILLYDTATFKPLEKLPQPDFAYNLLFLPSGAVLVAKLEGDNNAQFLRLWNARSGDEVARLPLDTTLNYGSLSNIMLSPDGTRLVLVDNAGVLHVWGVQGQ